MLRSTLFRPGDNARVTAPAMTLIEGMPARIRLAGVDGANLQLGVLVR